MLDAVIAFIAQDPYPALALVLVALGVGLPVPEEIVLLGAGYLCFRGDAEPAMVIAVAVPAIVAGDAVPFAAGRRFGERVLAARWMRRAVTPERRALLEGWFERHGDATILLGRFVPGLRLCAFLLGGTMQLGWRRFVALDAAAASVGATGLVLIGLAAGEAVDRVVGWVRQVEHGALALVLAAGLLWWLIARRRARARRRYSSSTPGSAGRGSAPPSFSCSRQKVTNSS